MNKSKQHYCFTILCLLTLLTFSSIASSQYVNVYAANPPILENNQTLLSSTDVFELGFFKPGKNSSGWYLGIWYKHVQNRTVVWVANRDSPLPDSSSKLIYGDYGNIVLIDQFGNITWSSNHTEAKNPYVQLLDTGNLVIQERGDADEQRIFWQSFDYPTHTLLPDMKLGWNLSTGLNRYITSWKSSEDPSTGAYSLKLDYHGLPEVFLWDKQVKKYRSGPWNGVKFSGVPDMSASHGIDFNFVTKQDEVYYSFSIQNKLESMYSGLIVSPNGDIQWLAWVESKNMWNIFWYAPKDQCDNYGECGPFGICDTNASPVCKCAKGFRPKNLEAWNLGNGSDGCVRKTELKCTKDKFLALRNVKLPESGGAFVDGDMNLEACEKKCFENCSCTAYSNAQINNGGTGCAIWFGELMDMREFVDGSQDLYVRLAASELDGDRKTKRAILVVGIIVGLCILLLGLGICTVVWKRNLHIKRSTTTDPTGPYDRSQVFLLNELFFTSKDFFSGSIINDDPELTLIDFNPVARATNNFSDENLLGEGGFGYVYKGKLAEGQEIAVKRLSKNSGQGAEEFTNELKIIARLQHINLVRLLACCIERDEQMLIYEYMENKSLDSFLFSREKRSMLDWPKRFNIICGIARGLVYLHQDSRFRIIHRDLKASNILLDGEFTPKISDFGMAKIFSKNQTESHTRRVVGTYGYMSPEYAMDGFFSAKSDVFSFGVLVLEIISGKQNKGFFYPSNKLNLLDRAWKQWTEGKGLEIMDPSLGDSYCPSEALRCIQVGLLCVQEQVVDRPVMSSVVFMLSCPDATMPQPKSPGFCLGRNAGQTDSLSFSSQPGESHSINQVTITTLDGR